LRDLVWRGAPVTHLLMVLGIKVPASFHRTAELGVAALLVTLGVTTLWAERELMGRRGVGARMPHAHGRVVHTHTPRTDLRALCFGLAHGLAGSGAVIVLLVAAATTRESQFGYLLAFGLGSIVGMSVVSAITGVVSAAAAARNPQWQVRMRVAAALVSTTAGMMLGWSVVFAG
jgi:hypothetical protein